MSDDFLPAYKANAMVTEIREARLQQEKQHLSQLIRKSARAEQTLLEVNTLSGDMQQWLKAQGYHVQLMDEGGSTGRSYYQIFWTDAPSPQTRNE